MEPLVEPGPPLTAEQVERSSRHLLLPGVGDAGQRRLRNARVCVVGAGGLGAPVLQYLAAAGVGALTVVDDDVVDASNLQRQVIHGVADVGRPKVDSARDAIARIDPSIEVRAVRTRLTSADVDTVLAGHDLVVDGTDNFPTRYLVDEACERLGVPLVWGSVLRFDAQVSVSWAAAGVTMRDLFPSAPEDGLSCAEAGVLGALCGQVGSVMATEVVKLVTGIGEPLLGRVLVVDALRARWSEVPVRVRPAATRPSVRSAPESPAAARSIDAATLADRLALRTDGRDRFELIDVREPAEAALASIPGARLVPLARVLDGSALDELPRDQEIVVHCAVGARSAAAVEVLRAAGFEATNLEGGIRAWQATGR
ncbi:molybdopterin-synthase adenylyltransferase MoeB [Cellulomonas alba]|uniref:Molybdopterin-synthase adenylyltransferase MoeB n=1 Tax=Cellulomonas alba TaxID=3053467 RepID=A0ABT7SFY4_9CELL|nr:molybdopterin-synthase adenylyltransferase MoeB [Cellulomonas alba]MDM7855095.1 molybdopterin-synthase adenylyltransferase MoeB [Cellulomonas alba]